MRTILIDDEKHSLEALRLDIEMYCPSLDIVALCPGPHEGIQAIQAHAPDLVFLDIQMPEMDAFELLKSVGEISFEVIFVTAFDSYTMQAIKVSAMDYLLKPVDSDELISAVSKAEERFALKRSKDQVDFLLTNLQQGSDQRFAKIALPTMQGLDFISVEDILYCHADGNYTNIYTTDGEKYIVSRTLSEFEEMLGKEIFFRTHKSFLVNLTYVKKYIRGSGGQVVLQGGVVVDVARARKDLLMDRIYNRS